MNDAADKRGSAFARLFGGSAAGLLRPVGNGLRGARRLPRWLGVSCVVIAAFAIVGLAGAAFFFARLAQGPIRVDLIGKQIEMVLGDRLGPRYELHLGETRIEDSEHGPTLSINGLLLKGLSGRTILAAPKAAVSIDPLALLGGKVSPKRLELQDVELRLVVLPDGTVAVSAGTDAAEAIPIGQAIAAASSAAPGALDSAESLPDGAAPGFGAMLGGVLAAMANPDGPTGVLERLGIARGRLVIDDRASHHMTEFKGFDLSFDRPSEGSAVLVARADGPNGRWSVKAQTQGRSGEPRTLDLEFRDLSLDEILLAGGTRDIGVDFDMPISANLSFRLSPEGALLLAKGRFAFGAGYILLDDPDHEPFLVDEITGGLAWNPATNRLDIERTQLFAGETQIAFTGTLAPPGKSGDGWAIEMSGADAVFGRERPGEQPIVIQRLRSTAHFFQSERRLAIDRLELAGPEVGMSAAGDITRTDKGIKLRLGMTASRMPIQTAVRLWPSFINAKTRAWFLANIQGGFVDNGALAIDFDEQTFADIRAQRPAPDDAVRIEFTVTDGRVTTLKGLPPLTGVEGNGLITGRTASFMAHAAIEAHPGKRLSLSEGSFSVPDTSVKPTPATVSVRLTGGADALADVLSRDGLSAYATLPAHAGAVKGQVDGRLSADFKLGQPAPPDDTGVRVNATLSNLSVDRLIGPEKLDAANLSVSVDHAGLRVTGEGRAFGAPVTIDVKRPPNSPGEATFTVTLDDAARAKRGFNLESSLTGPVTARLTAPLGPGAESKAQLDIDLTRAAIDGLVPGLVKPAGRAAKATTTVIVQDDGVALDQIAYEGGSASMRGSAKLDADGNFQQAKLTQLRLSPGDDVKVDVAQTSDGLKIIARATSLDARPFLQLVTNPAPSARETGRKDLDLDLKAANVTGHNGQTASGVDFRMARRAGQFQQLQLAGHFGRSPITASLTKRDGAPIIVIDTTDAGALLAFYDFYRRMKGGDLSIMLRPSEGRLDGNVQIHDFILKDEPAMRRLVTEGVAGGDDRFGHAQVTLDASAVAFTKMSAVFSRAASRVELRDGVMWGPQIGATVDGSVDFARDRVDLGGTFVPAYQVNNLFSKIPLFGPILGGGSHEGLFAINYKISGPASAPVLSFNPLSAIAPGFLRKVFGVIDGTAVRGDVPTAPIDAGRGPALH